MFDRTLQGRRDTDGDRMPARGRGGRRGVTGDERLRPGAKITIVLSASTLLAALVLGSIEVVRLFLRWRFQKLNRARAVIGKRWTAASVAFRRTRPKAATSSTNRERSVRYRSCKGGLNTDPCPHVRSKHWVPGYVGRPTEYNT